MTPESKHKRLVSYRPSVQASWSDYEITGRDYTYLEHGLDHFEIEDVLLEALNALMKHCYPRYPADPLAAALIAKGWSDAPATGRWN